MTAAIKLDSSSALTLTSAGPLWHLLSILPLLLLCVTDERNILEQIKGSEGLYIFMRLKCQTVIQTSVQSDTWATVKTAKHN